MSDPPVVVERRNGIVATAGDTAKSAVTALGTQPTLLLILLLNMMMIGTAGWFFIKLEEFRHDERLEIIRVLGICFPPAPSPSRLPPAANP